MSELLTGILILLGAGFVGVAGLGLLRLPDVFIRMHASAKAGTLGAGLILMAAAVHFGELSIVARAVMIALFVFLTAPIAAHLISRAAYRTGTPLWRYSVVDDLKDDQNGSSTESAASSQDHLVGARTD
ncbi:MAG: monovalent cation/H(+) antiporter subunit G [Pseudomonadota bacterium]